jgi:hypothetical protein
VDDGIFDTPNAKDKNYTCSNPKLNTCTDPVNDKPDMTENYMDYALDGCCGMFTHEQAFVMRYVLNRFRTGLPFRTISYDTVSDFPNTVVSVYPNPTFGQNNVTVLVNNNEDHLKFSLSLIDGNGRQIISRNLTSNVKEYLYLEPYAPSVYYLLIKDAGGSIVKKEKLVIMP